MSTKRLNTDERASFQIGQALRAVLTAPKGTYSPSLTWLAWFAYGRVVPAILTPDEAHAVMLATGCDLDIDQAPAPWEESPSLFADLAESYALAHGMEFPQGGPGRELTAEERASLQELTRQIFRASRTAPGTA